MKNKHETASLADVAAYFGVSQATVRTHWRPSMPGECGRPGRWNLAAIGRWLARRQMAPRRTAVPGQPTN